MKYKTRIFPEGDGYVGQAMLDEEVVYTTNVVKDGILAARELSTFIANNSTTKANVKTNVPKKRLLVPPTSAYNEVPSSKSINSEGPFHRASSEQEYPSDPSIPIPRKCCGRG